jgi:predicted RNA methylase
MEACTYSKSVVGTDVNARAIEFARFNAALNGVQNISFCAGDAFQPVSGRKFTRIVANPPFFLSRASKYTFSDSPVELDGFTGQLARQAPSFLEEGGFFQMICEWVQIGDQPWPERLAAWTEGSGCDVFVLRRTESLFTPVQYAEHRMEEAQLLHSNPSPDMFEDQLSHLKEKGVTLVCGGIITMRKRSGSNWFETAIGSPAGNELGQSILRRFNQLTITHTRPERELLKERYQFAGDAAIQQRHALKDGRWELTGGEIISTGGFEGKFAVDPIVSQFLPLFDGNTTVGEIAAHVAADLKLNSQEADKRCIDLTRRLLRNGFVERV